ncbi:MAG: phenylacetate--CoA ligase family protein [Burkholderiales bacterium]|nr:phenylacetate--CoA ligase family protein [Burkholderiales bacterium]
MTADGGAGRGDVAASPSALPPPLPLRSSLDDIAWPALTAGNGPLLLSLDFQLRRSQWWSTDAIAGHQMRQLRELVGHAVRHVPFYRDHMRRAAIFTVAGVQQTSFLRWPLLARGAVRAAADALQARWLPPEHGRIDWQSTTGSTGMPVRVASTLLDGLIREAPMLRAFGWYGIDARGKFATIRPKVGRLTHATWNPVYEGMLDTGPLVTLNIAEDIDAQLDWLCEEEPDYLLSLGSNLRSLILRSRDTGRRPARLKVLLSYADQPPADLAALAAATWGAAVHDLYSAAEFGPLAFQCPEHGNLHVQSENVLVEILDEAGAPCPPGTPGRVVVTGLHNFAMPLIRYELGDYASFGPACACGRGLPVIASINGRSRNMAVDPTGRRFWPMINPSVWLSTPIEQRQLVQHAPGEIEIRYVAPRELIASEEAQVIEVLSRNFRHDYTFRFTRVERLERSAGGKFEEFVCLVAPT